MEMIEIGTISARGQICIPRNIREQLGLEDGTKVIFAIKEGTLLMKKAESISWEEITKPLREAMKKSDMKESDVPDLVHKIRRENASRSRH